jgi:hypothetical protein
MLCVSICTQKYIDECRSGFTTQVPAYQALDAAGAIGIVWLVALPFRIAGICLRTALRAAVDTFVASLEHRQKPAIDAIRQVTRGSDPAIVEGIKWNSPSFRTTEYFATTHLRTKDGVGLIFHLGAKVRDIPSVPIDDPEGLLKWLAKDRAIVTFSGVDDVWARKAAAERIVRQWIKHV